MLIVKPAALLTLIIFSQIVSGCSSSVQNSNSTNAGRDSIANSKASPKDNIEEFSMIVRFPFEPEEVVWKEDGNTLTAVVRFSHENADRLSAELAKAGPPTPETLAVENWYPNELVAQSDLGGESAIKGNSYPAGALLNPPYTTGKITRVESSDYFIIHISS